MKIVTLHYDHDMQNPCDDEGGFKVHGFNRRLTSYTDPDTLFPDGKPSLGLRRKLECGTAFFLSYFEHGNCVWSLRGQGPQCEWDSVRTAGLLVYEGKASDLGKTKEDREKAAKAFLEVYTAWCNGDGYGYTVDEVKTLPCGHKEIENVDSCFGFYGNDLEYMAAEVRAAVDGDPEVQIKGEAEGISGYHDFGQRAAEVRP